MSGKTAKVTVVVFPGSNCDHDVIHTYQHLLDCQVTSVWHRDRDLKNPDIVVLPGGFAYGDYLRTGALAKISPVMQEVIRFAERGGKVLGVCNGFQILCESGLLPGVLMQNSQRKFLSRFVHLKVENNSTPFTSKYAKGAILTCPIAHNEGNFYADESTLKLLEDKNRIVLRYCSAAGVVDPHNFEWNPNGAARSIAGICSEKGNVVGMMPHPERAAEKRVGDQGKDTGLAVFQSSLA